MRLVSWANDTGAGGLLTDCTLSVSLRVRIAGLVGPNGAGKTTLLHLVTGLLAPTTGAIEVAGGLPAATWAQLARVGFVAQDAPVYAGFSVADHLRLGAHLNPRWDKQLASRPDPAGWAWTRRRRPGSCPAASGPSWP